ncbi:hypothetical protein V9T40_010251 [Parthenolecanium corni]|uniref:Dolichyl-phosphate beta-glucosyltransferase n=1 Tax=Parthenolecanium corni TaxID=536013 RepID=A0AAN9TC37_9HEMI
MFFFSDVFEPSVFLFSLAAIIVVIVLCVPFVMLLTASPLCEIIRYNEEEHFIDENATLQTFPSLMEHSQINLSVIVPAYNEEVRLEPMLDEALDFLLERQRNIPRFTFEIVIVNDGSKDGTAKVAAKYTKSYGSDKVRVLNLIRNRGKGGAVRLGVLSARGSVILFADADGATKFSDIVKLENELRSHIQVDYIVEPDKVGKSVAIVCGSRAHLEQEAVANRSFFRTILMYGFHFLVWLFTVRTIKDTQCGFKMFTREAAVQCFHNLHVERWAFDVELLYVANRFSIPVSEVAVNWQEIEGSKIVPVFSWLQMALDLFLIWFRYFIGAWDVTLVHKKNK